MSLLIAKCTNSQTYLKTLTLLTTKQLKFSLILCRTANGKNLFQHLTCPTNPFIHWKHAETFSVMKRFYYPAMLAKFFDLVENTLPGNLSQKKSLMQNFISDIHKQKNPFNHDPLFNPFFDVELYHETTMKHLNQKIQQMKKDPLK